jgi:benzylsuccinate CoA-transferase BbsF subunit
MKGIFAGLKVLDFTWALTGPRTTRYLADQGATVIKVEYVTHLCIIRQAPPYRGGKSGLNKSAYFTALNPSKLSLGIDITHPGGREIIKRLVGWADIVAESFAPGIMEKFGLDFDGLCKIKPDIIFLRTNLFGNSGPMANVAGFGVQLVGHSGFTNITGWPDRIPVQIFGAYTDFIAPRFNVAALITALLYRRRTGKGMCIEVSQH